MNYLSIDYLIVYAFLAITLFIGLRAGRGIKDIREYALANKMYGTVTLTLTFLATNIGGSSIIEGAAYVFSEGVVSIIPEFGVILTALIVALFIAKKIIQFEGCLTLGDVMERLYGRGSKLIAGVLGLFYSIAMVSMELLGLGIVFETLLGIKAGWGIMIGGLILAIYSGHGGIKSVTITDVFQFLILIIVFPLIANIALKYAGGLQAVFASLSSTTFQIFEHKNFSYYLTLFLVWSIFPVGITSPPLFQRLLMAKEAKQIRDQYFVVAAFHPTFQLLIMLIGLAGLVLYPTIEAKNLVPHIIQQLLPIGAKGLAIAGLLAVIMSTADSYLHAAGLVLAHDILKPICDKIHIKINELRFAQYGTVVIGVAAIAIALHSTSMLGLSFAAVRFTGPLLMFPLIFGILGLKTDKQSFYIASVVTLITFVAATWLLPTQYSHLAVLISIIANGLSFITTHLIKNRGFAIVDRSQGTGLLWHPRRKNLLDNLKQLSPTPSRIIQYSIAKIARYGAPYTLFGTFFVINYTLPFFMWTHSSPQIYNLIFTLRLIGGLLCGLLIVHEKWPKWLVSYMPTYWHLTVLYCLPFMSTLMFLLTQGSTEWIINIAMTIILLLILVDWVTGLILGSIGVILGFVCCKWVVGDIELVLDFSTTYLLIYQGIFGLLIGLLFARRKQQRFDQLATDNQILTITEQEDKEALLETFKEKIRLLQTLKQAGIQNLSQVVKLVKELRTQGKETFKEEAQPLNHILQQLENTVTPMAVALERIENRVTDYLRLDIKPIAINKLLEELQEHLPNQRLHYKIHTEYLQITCDPTKLIKMLVQGITALQADKETHQPVYIGLQDTKLAYPIHSLGKNYSKQIPALGFSLTLQSPIAPLEASYKAQMNGSSLPVPETTQELLLVTNQRIIKAHYGYTNIDLSQKTNYDTYLYVLPVDLAEIRPRDMNDPSMELGMSLVRADDTYPGAKEQEQKFLAAVQQKSKANLESIKTALEVIKWYHGAKNRHSGEPFYLHPLAVAQIVLEYNQDEATILGALLHDTVEDTAMLLENIDMMFGPDVVKIVDGVTHFESLKDSFYKIKLSTHENILMLLKLEDKRALYVKIADRMHNIRTIEGHRSHAKKQQIAEETLQFFVPLAQALGLEQAVAELQARSAKILNISDQQ